MCFFRRHGVPKTPSDRACLAVKACLGPRYLRLRRESLYSTAAEFHITSQGGRKGTEGFGHPGSGKLSVPDFPAARGVLGGVIFLSRMIRTTRKKFAEGMKNGLRGWRPEKSNMKKLLRKYAKIFRVDLDWK